MTSKHYRWQLRWQLDLDAATAVHECGLQVHLTRTPGVMLTATAVNAEEAVQALAVKHGHNAPQMLARMLREARQLHAEALAGGSRRG
jgi:hypothetical protein